MPRSAALGLDNVRLHGDPTHRLPNTLNVSLRAPGQDTWATGPAILAACGVAARSFLIYNPLSSYSRHILSHPPFGQTTKPDLWPVSSPINPLRFDHHAAL